MKAFRKLDDCMGAETDVIDVSDHIVTVRLLAGAPRTITVPGGATSVLFSGSDDFWMRVGAPAVVPTADILEGTSPELNPFGRMLQGATVIGLAAPRDCFVSLAFYG